MAAVSPARPDGLSHLALPAPRSATKQGKAVSQQGRKLSGRLVASDATIYRTYWIRFGGKRGALTRTAEEVGCSLTHVARVLSRHAPRAIPRGIPVQAVRSDAGEIDYVTPRPAVVVPPINLTRHNDTAAFWADIGLALYSLVYIAVGLLEVWPLVFALLPIGVVARLGVAWAVRS